MPSSSVAIAVASRRPIQMGKFSLFSESLRITIGVFVTGSSVSPPTVMRMNCSRPMKDSPFDPPHSTEGLPICNLDPWALLHDEPVDHAIKLIQVATFFDDVAELAVTLHLAVAEAPRVFALGVQPDELLGP